MSRRLSIAALAALSLLVAACSGATGTPPAITTPTPSPPIVSASTAPTLGLLSSPTPSSASPGSSGSPPAAVAIDPGLLTVLPAEVDGRLLRESTDAEAGAAGTPAVAAAAESFAAAEVSDATGQNLAIATLLLVRPGVPPDSLYQSYRSSYDASACAAIGGVASTATAEIGGRTVDTTSCGGGATVYHLRLRDGRLIVSVLELGATGFGRALVEGATE